MIQISRTNKNKSILSIAILLALILIMLFQTAMVIIPRLCSLTVLYVSGESMAPTLHRGDLIMIESVAFSDIHINDILTFADVRKPSYTFTHRVVNIDKGARALYTKGDAEVNRDVSPTSYDCVRGRVVYSFPILGYVAILTHNIWGMALMLLLLIIWIILEIGGARKKHEN